MKAPEPRYSCECCGGHDCVLEEGVAVCPDCGSHLESLQVALFESLGIPESERSLVLFL